MAINMSIDLSEATFSDLVALVSAARAAGVNPATGLKLEGNDLTLAVEPAATPPAPRAQAQRSQHDTASRPLPQLGDAAIRSVVDILTGRQEPPRA